MVLRMLVLESHYRSEAHFSWETMQASANRLLNWHAASALQWQPVAVAPVYNSLFADQQAKIQSALENDLDTPLALSIIDATFNQIMLGIRPDELTAYIEFLQYVDAVLGLQIGAVQDIDDDSKSMLADRQAAKDAKNYITADELRAKLAANNVTVRDTAYGPLWAPTSLQ